MKRYTTALLVGVLLVVSLAWSGALHALEFNASATNASPQMPDQWGTVAASAAAAIEKKTGGRRNSNQHADSNKAFRSLPS